MSAKILIVDDEKNVRLNYRITLETEGYEIFEAVSAANALEELVERSFDLAILDMRMPAMDGLQLLAKMREVGITVPEPIRIRKPASQAAAIKEVSIDSGVFAGVRSSGRNGVALSRDLTKQHKRRSVKQRRDQGSE